MKVIPVGAHRQRECGDNYWSIEHLNFFGTAIYSPPLRSFEWGYIVTIDCWDGGTYEFEIWVDMGSQLDWPNEDTVWEDWEAYAWNEIYDQAEEIAAKVCRPCSDPLVVS